MIYVALRFSAENFEDHTILGFPQWVSDATYVDLCEATGLSRVMVMHGLQRLCTFGLIRAEGSPQKRRYHLIWEETSWFKLPCEAIVVGNQIRPFHAFTLRSKYELHAMKLYLYIAAVRLNNALHSEVGYEKIHERLGITEREIRLAISHLLNCGLLNSSDRERGVSSGHYGPNQYYLAGHKNLLRDVASRAVVDATNARREAHRAGDHGQGL